MCMSHFIKKALSGHSGRGMIPDASRPVNCQQKADDPSGPSGKDRQQIGYFFSEDASGGDSLVTQDVFGLCGSGASLTQDPMRCLSHASYLDT